MRSYDLEERLIEFTCKCIVLAESLPKTFACNHISSQLIRSGTSPALNYGEAQSAESRKDFIHKMKVCLKELRETFCCLRIINKGGWIPTESLTGIIQENIQLISIFVASIKTAESKLRHPTTKP